MFVITDLLIGKFITQIHTNLILLVQIIH